MRTTPTWLQIPSQPFGEQLAEGQLSAAAATARTHRDYPDRGPHTSRTTISDDTIVVLMHDTLTKAERSLVAAGRRHVVLDVRQTFQDANRPELVSAVEQLTGRTAVAFMSSNHFDADLAARSSSSLPVRPLPESPVHEIGRDTTASTEHRHGARTRAHRRRNELV
jgi:uncharacterized protein YbcI